MPTIHTRAAVGSKRTGRQLLATNKAAFTSRTPTVPKVFARSLRLLQTTTLTQSPTRSPTHFPTTPLPVLYRANAYCAGAWDVERRKLPNSPSAAGCLTVVLADELCGQFYYYVSSSSTCRCVLKGKACSEKESNRASIYQISSTVTTFAPNNFPSSSTPTAPTWPPALLT